MRYFRTEDNTGFKYIHSKDDKVIYIENETAEAPQFSLQYGDKLIQIFVTNDEYRPERDIVGTPDLFTLSYHSDMNDKGQYILATEAEINIYEDDYFNIDELKTVGETDILIKYFEYDELVWQGFALPDFFQTGITNVRVLRMVATDRLGVLKNIANTSVSNTPKEIIEECLSQTGLVLPVEIRSIDNYLTSTTIERERIEGISAYDVIRAFMVQFNSKIVQYKNRWWIVNKKILEDGFSDQEIIDTGLAYLDGQRGIKPTASEVSLYMEFGGAKRYPKNWNFDKWTSNALNNWTSYNGFVQNKNSKVPIRYNSNYSLIYGQDTNINSLLSRNAFRSQLTDPNFINSPHIRSDEISMQFIEGVSELNFEIDFTSINDDRLALDIVLLIRIPNRNPSYDDYIAVGPDGRIVEAGTTNIDLTKVPTIRIQPAVDENQDRLTAIRTTAERSFKISALEDLGLTRGTNANIQVLLFGTEYYDGTSTSLIDIVLHSTKISFNDFETKGKGLIFKTKQGGDKFSKVRETETTLFSDKINQGVNGYFYNYKYDDTSITNLPKEYLLAMTRQMADMFCSARDFYSLGGKFKVNPLARYRCGSKYFVLVGGQSKRKTASIEIEEIVSNEGLIRTDYIYTYFEDSKDNIKSIGTASGAGGGSGGSGSGGGMTSSQLEMLAKSHSHLNKNILDTITQDVIEDSHKHENKSLLDTITQDVIEDSHKHENKSLLDTITQDVIEDSHKHENKSLLDTITQEMLDNALREMLGVESTEEITDENYFSALRTLKEILDNNEALKDLFLSKINDDTAEGFIQFLKGISVEGLATFLQGISVKELATFLNGISVEELATLTQGLEIGDYSQGLLGSGGAFKMKNGLSELEVDKLTVRMMSTFFEIVVSKLRHINGGLVLSRGAMTCSRVVEDADSYQCFFERGENNEISNTFVVNDQARCQVFNSGNQKFYWRLVTAVGDDWIRLSKTVGIGDSIPTAGDDIVQLGYQGNDLAHVKRLNAQIIDESGISQYVEIDSFTLEGKRRNFISADGTGSQFTGKVSFKNAGVDYDLSDWAHETETAIDKARAVTDKFGTTIDGGLVQTVMMLLREADALNETAGISGIQGEDEEQPFLWGGGTHAQALKFKTFLEQVESGTPPTKDALPNFVANHNGAVKLGRFIFNSLGQMVILDKKTGMALLIIDDNEIPSKAEVLSSGPKDIFRDNERGEAPYDGVYMFPAALETTATGGQLIITGTIKFLGTIFATPDGAGYQGKINLYKDDIYFSTLYTGGVSHRGGYDKDIDETISLNKTIHNLPKGTYTLGIEGYGFSSSVVFSLETSKMRWDYDGVNDKIHIGSNGIMAYFGDKLLHYTDADGLTVRGPVDMPPPPEAPQDVLCTQRLAQDGYVYEHTGIPITCTRINVGEYRVVHNIGHYYYVLTCASMTAMRSYHISLHNATTCEIEWRDASGDLTDTDFRFTIIGRNKYENN